MNELTQSVFSSRKYTELIRSIRIRSVTAEFPAIELSDRPSEVDWNYALLCASALTADGTESAQKAVLRIATAVITANEETTLHQKNAAAVLLERVGNHRSVDLAERRNLIEDEAWRNLPPLLRLEVIRSRLELSIPLSTGKDLLVNRFQGDFWSGAEKYSWLSVSAPTSAGKSRIVLEWFLEKLRNADLTTVVYLAPTRALVEEIAMEFRREVDHRTGVFSTPWAPDLDRFRKRVLVVTQERLHLVQETHRPFVIDLLFVDEAQSLGGNERGIILQQVIHRAISANANTQVIFASPMSSNPEILIDRLATNTISRAIVSEAVTVDQNLLRVEAVLGRPSRRRVALINDGQPIHVGYFELARRPTRVPMRLAYVAYTLGIGSGGNIVYVNGADEAEKVAHNIADLSPDYEKDSDISALQELIRTAVHPKYSLIQVLESKVAFHYGNMPLAIRSEIERLFGAGKIDFLVCTSTLLEGVNLPCKSIFVRNPQKGRGNPLTAADFWNLAGRAGRWGKEFYGNIVCIDTDDPQLWPNLPAVRHRYDLQLATERGLKSPDRLKEYIANGFPVGSSYAGPEHLFSFLVARRASGGDVTSLISQIPTEVDRLEVLRSVESTVDGIDFPPQLVEKHIGVSPHAMKRLLAHFREQGHDPHVMRLPLPEEPDARARLQRILVIIGATMTVAFGNGRYANGPDRRKWQLANLLVNWMNGFPLARLIEQRASSTIPLARAIRDVMADIETIARFQAPKFLSCYEDLLAVYAAERGVHDLDPGPEIAMMLELGVSRSSEVVLMSLGLSRTAVVNISGFVTRDNWTTEECLEWLRSQNIAGWNIPVLIQREIYSVLDSHSVDSPEAK